MVFLFREYILLLIHATLSASSPKSIRFISNLCTEYQHASGTYLPTRFPYLDDASTTTQSHERSITTNFRHSLGYPTWRRFPSTSRAYLNQPSKLNHKMPGLIPLRMSTLIPASKITFTTSEEKSSYTPSHTSWGPTPSGPRTNEVPRRTARERTIPAPIIAPKLIPSTPEQWKRALGDVKRDFVNRKYRQCSVRCHEFLEGINDSVRYIAEHVVFVTTQLTNKP